ncbi:MAG: metallophosphoesterase family protein [Chloroflexota bacterium]|nr:metallophosphoesterase family protein [Chloroflexota bacterium]
MRYAILGDIHGNLVAFRAVLADIEARGGCDKVWCLGDVVGYGPEPHSCIGILRNRKHVCVAGNHDWAAIGKVDISDFNPDAAQACRWTTQQLDALDRDYLAKLPEKLVLGEFTLVHGSPRYPVWEYLDPDLFPMDDICQNFDYFDTKFCLVGHSHKPLILRQDKAGNCLAVSIFDKIGLNVEGERVIINPGGVGQPRDGDCRASYIIYDSGTQMMYHHRCNYDIRLTQEKMREYKLPLSLIVRLDYGY